ncbi:PQQ-dependent sugar dehydrogenase [Sciscionella marina]|uniref:PQQ-dependent sugar dehydrogenase n=1 Tax=Sciscionella marina TaxID=508770 RepID=UPI0004766AF4|nr:PQQ-dependent sugar dehydrogenase [Sciscionella marina]
MSLSGRSTRRARTALAAAMVSGAVVLTGCADFSKQASPGHYTAAPSLNAEQPPQPEGPGESGTGGGSPSSQTSVPPPQGCTDFHENVIGTCLGAVSAVAALPGNAQQPSALAAERSTGRILQVSKGTPPTQLAKLDVDATGGGVTGLALSPHYDEDQLIYAYVTTATGNQVVRFAAGQAPKPILTGIPKGAKDNGGSLALDHKGALLVATGDAGNASAANNPKSLAGKVLRIDGDGKPAPGNPDPHSPVLASGVHAPGGVCATLDGSASYVTDQGGARDQLFHVAPGKLREPTWSWPDKPGVAGCSATAKLVTVNATKAGNMQGIALNTDGSVNGQPQVGVAGKDGFGKLSGMDVLGEGIVVVGTANKEPGGKPVSSDDRVFIIQPQAGGGTGKD